MHDINIMIFLALANLLTLDLSYNIITTIEEFAFASNTKLETLLLQHNRIQVIRDNTFDGLQSLIHLNMSTNKLGVESFGNIHIFRRLHKLSQVIVNNVKTCCMFNLNVSCISDIQGTVSYATDCGNIITHVVIVILLYFYGIGNVLLNSYAFFSQIKSVKVQQALLHCSLNIADGLMGIYVFTLIVFNHLYQGEGANVAMVWKRSTLCHAISFIAMSSLLMSKVSTLMIALDRLVCIVVRPFERCGFSTKQSVIAVVVGLCVGLPIPTTNIVFSDTELNNICILIGSSSSLVLSIIFLVSHTILFILITLVYGIILYVIVKSAKLSRSQTLLVKAHIRIGVILVSYFVASTTVLILSALRFYIQIPSTIESIIVCMLVPLNSCLNPLINCFKW